MGTAMAGDQVKGRAQDSNRLIAVTAIRRMKYRYHFTGGRLCHTVTEQVPTEWDQ